MNPATQIITARHTGLLSIQGVGRVGSYEAARRGCYCRPRREWVIEEKLPEVRVTRGTENGCSWECRTIQEVREDLGSFKTKTLAIKFLADYAREHGLAMEGNPKGVPFLQLPPVS